MRSARDGERRKRNAEERKRAHPGVTANAPTKYPQPTVHAPFARSPLGCGATNVVATIATPSSQRRPTRASTAARRSLDDEQARRRGQELENRPVPSPLRPIAGYVARRRTARHGAEDDEPVTGPQACRPAAPRCDTAHTRRCADTGDTRRAREKIGVGDDENARRFPRQDARALSMNATDRDPRRRDASPASPAPAYLHRRRISPHEQIHHPLASSTNQVTTTSPNLPRPARSPRPARRAVNRTNATTNDDDERERRAAAAAAMVEDRRRPTVSIDAPAPRFGCHPLAHAIAQCVPAPRRSRDDTAHVQRVGDRPCSTSARPTMRPIQCGSA